MTNQLHVGVQFARTDPQPIAKLFVSVVPRVGEGVEVGRETYRITQVVHLATEHYTLTPDGISPEPTIALIVARPGDVVGRVSTRPTS